MQHHSVTAALAAVAVAALALLAVPAATQSATDINNSFSDYNFVPAVSPQSACQSIVCCQHWFRPCLPAARKARPFLHRAARCSTTS